MLDAPTFPLKPPQNADWQDNLSPGDIVMFRFPVAGQTATARPAARPCLVLDIEVLAGRRCAVLAPGFPARRPAGQDRAISVGRRADYRAARLDRPTMFAIRSRRLVPLAHPGFVVLVETGSPVLGRLPDAAMDRMHAERVRLRALRDIRADRTHSGDRRPHRRGPMRGRDFTVERRNPRRPIPMPRFTAARGGT